MAPVSSNAGGSSSPVVLITGCGEGGIGYHLALEYARHGARVYATSRTLESMTSLLSGARSRSNGAGGNASGATGRDAGSAILERGIVTMQLDVTDRKQVEQVVEEVVAQAGRIDILVNNAGAVVGAFRAVLDHTVEDVHSTFEVNLMGPFHMCQVVGRHMAERRSGHIVNVGSVNSFFCPPLLGPYNASKWALQGLTNTLRLEMRHLGVQVTYLAPGAVQSNILREQPNVDSDVMAANAAKTRNMMRKFRKDGTPTDVFARQVVAALLRRPPPVMYVAGHNGLLAWWLSWLLPASWLDALLGAMFGW